MKKLTHNDPEMRSSDLLLENLERLKAIFPEAFTEGKIDFAVLKGDSAFADDVAKTNLAAILEQNIPSDQLSGIRSL